MKIQAFLFIWMSMILNFEEWFNFKSFLLLQIILDLYFMNISFGFFKKILWRYNPISELQVHSSHLNLIWTLWMYKCYLCFSNNSFRGWWLAFLSIFKQIQLLYNWVTLFTDEEFKADLHDKSVIGEVLKIMDKYDVFF